MGLQAVAIIALCSFIIGFISGIKVALPYAHEHERDREHRRR